MAKGSTVLKIAGILMVIFGVLGILFAMLYGFVGALTYQQLGQETLTGLLVFYGLYGIMTGFFLIAVGAIAIRHCNKAEHWLRCVIWGIVVIAIGVICYILLHVTSGMMNPANAFYPQWFCYAIIIAGCFVFPVIMIIGGLLNRVTYKKTEVPE